MAHVNRIRKENLRDRVYPTSGSGVIEVGDLLVVSGGFALAASSKTATGGSAGTRKTSVQDQVADAFIGIAKTAKRSDRQNNILVAVDCVAEYPCAALGAAKVVGDTVEIDDTDDNTTGTASSQQVIPGTVNPIGKLERAAAVGDTMLTVHFVGKDVAAIPVAD